MNLYLHLEDTDILMDDNFKLNSYAEMKNYLKTYENKIITILRNKYSGKLYMIQTYEEGREIFDKLILRVYFVTFETRSFSFYFFLSDKNL